MPAVWGSSSETSVPHWPCFSNLPRAAEELLAGPIDEAELDVAAVIGAAVPRQLGLGIEQIDVRRPAVHEERDHRLGFWRKVGLPREQVERVRIDRFGRRTGQHFVFAQQAGQRDAAQSQRVALEKRTARLPGEQVVARGPSTAAIVFGVLSVHGSLPQTRMPARYRSEVLRENPRLRFGFVLFNPTLVRRLLCG